MRSKKTNGNPDESTIDRSQRDSWTDDIQIGNRAITITTLIAAIAGVIGIVMFVLSISLHLQDGDNNSANYYSSNANSLWALTGLLLLYAAFMAQKIELQLQRKDLQITHHEMAMTRAELQGQKEQFAIQNSNLRQQRFEDGLFNMLSLLESSRSNWETTNTIKATNGIERDKRLTGSENIRYIWDDIYSEISLKKYEGKSEQFIYLDQFKKEENWFLQNNIHHFVLLDQIVDYIMMNDDLPDEEHYLSLFFLQITPCELMLYRAYSITLNRINTPGLISDFSKVDLIIDSIYPNIKNHKTFS